MKKTTTTYLDFICRGRKVTIEDAKGNKVTYQRRVGAVAAIVEGTTLSIGWSLCNHKEGDTFNFEHAKCLAIGRAKEHHKNSLTFKTKIGTKTVKAPTEANMVRNGVPQSSLSTMARVIKKALAENPDILEVRIYNSKTPQQATKPSYMW